jgi:hypothetical protein
MTNEQPQQQYEIGMVGLGAHELVTGDDYRDFVVFL